MKKLKIDSNNVKIEDFIFSTIFLITNNDFDKRLDTDDYNQIVYHYTSFDSFFHIMRTESLIASNALYLNDKNEFHLSIELFKTALIDFLEKSKMSKIIEKVVIEIIKNIQNIRIADNYVTCFSGKKDVLNQWMAYGDRGNGLAIGFDAHKLDYSFQHQTSGSWINYDFNNGRQILDNINEKYFSKLLEFANVIKFNTQNEIANFGTKVYLRYIVSSFISKFKHKSFEDEKEYRLSLSKEVNKSLNLEIDYMNKNRSLIVPYTKLILADRFVRDREDIFLENEERIIGNQMALLPISEIILGPCVDISFSEPGLKMFLESVGYGHVKILRSEIPLRNM